MQIYTNRLAIIVDDGAVYSDHRVWIGLDFSNCNIPNDIHALQWKDGVGHIEYRDTSPNLDINELPIWAINCYDLALSIPEEMMQPF